MPNSRNKPQGMGTPLHYLDVSQVAATRTVDFSPSRELTSGSSRRAAQAIRLVKSAFREELACTIAATPPGIAVTFPEATETEILEVCSAVEEKLKELQNRPLTAKMVEEVLSITAVERLRWSKDGRIPTAAHAFFGNGKKQVRLFEYPAHTIRELSGQPERIAGWRVSSASK